MGYQPIENYGIIGNMRTLALVGINGSIDWWCFPHFDSPSVFAGILDDKKGGRFAISPLKLVDVTSKQFYWPESNVLVTKFLSTDGVGEITDFMPVGESLQGPGEQPIVRTVNVDRGSMAFRVECRPAFNYARDPHTVEITPHGACFSSPTLSLGLATRTPLKQERDGVTAEFFLQEGESATFVLRGFSDGSGRGLALSDAEATKSFEETVAYWRRWIGQCSYTGRWREVVHRSAMALKLLTFEPTGAIVAAPTCSLPEGLGGERNWDYRYTWIRDAAFTLYGFLRIGFTQEAAKFMEWLEARCHELNTDGSLQIMYGIDGRHTLTEETLDHLEGYKQSRPVRIGNGAYGQLQLDIYGELMDSVYLYNKYGSPISSDLWTHLRRLVDWVCDHWQGTDEGVWEVRGGQQEFVYSKLMCWVAIDRGLRLADKRSFPADRNRWVKVRDQIYEEILERGWSEKRQAFVQHYGSESLDASNLMMPLVFFMSPSDPRMLKTLDALNQSPAQGGLVSNSLVYRYNVEETADGLRGEEGTFNICTFWLVEALTRAGRTDHRRLEEARLMFENNVGLREPFGALRRRNGSARRSAGKLPASVYTPGAD